MSGISMVLNTAKNAIAIQQYGLSVTSHNIANVNSPHYSRQRIPLQATAPAPYGGLLFGTGVEAEQIQRSVDQLLESRLMVKKSDLSAFEETETYMLTLEKIFNTSSESSLNNLLSDFWNSWQDLSNNPLGSSERVGVYQTGALIAARFNTLNSDIMQLETELNLEIASAASEINTISAGIAQLNENIVGLEVGRTANDMRDERNAMLTRLSQLVDIQTFEQDEGDVTVTFANGFVLVNDIESYNIQSSSGQIEYVSTYGGTIDVTDRIAGGKVGGWITMRDEVTTLYSTELDVLAKEYIWEVNLQHSQGVGLEYISSPLSGTYATDTSGRLDTLDFGNKIDYTKDFKMWIQDVSTAISEYTPVEIDMGISTAAPTTWGGAEPAGGSFKYVFTVTEDGRDGLELNITETDGTGLGTVQTGATISAALARAIGIKVADDAQIITVTDASALTQTVTIKDIGGDAERSAASIADALSALTGVTAYASSNTATLDITNILAGAGDAEENDRITFTLSSGETTDIVSFHIGANDTATLANFQDAIRSSVSAINGSTSDLSATFSGNTASITSASGENIGVENFDVEDLPVTTLDTFSNFGVLTRVDIDNFTNFQKTESAVIDNFSSFVNGDTVTFAVTTDLGSVDFTYNVTDATDQTTLADNFESMLTSGSMQADLAAIGVSMTRVGDTFRVTGSVTANRLDFSTVSHSTQYNPSFGITPETGTHTTDGDNALTFSTTSDFARVVKDNPEVSFAITTDLGTVNVNFEMIDDTDQTTMANSLQTALSSGTMVADLAAIGVTTAQIGTSVRITGSTAAGYVDFQELSAGPDSNESFDLTAVAGSVEYPTGGDNVLNFDGNSETEQFAGDNRIEFDVNGTTINVDLRRQDGTDADIVRTAFFNALDGNVTDATIEDTGSAITITSTAETDPITLNNDTRYGTVVAISSFDAAANQGTLAEADNTFTLNGGGDSVTYAGMDVDTDDITFEGQTLTENGAVDSAVKAGTVSIFLDDGYTIQSDVDGTGAAGGLFNFAADTVTTNVGDSIITLGGTGGFSNFDVGDTITFNVDGTAISYTVLAGEDTDEEYAAGLETQLAAGLGAAYDVVRTGASVSIMKTDATTPAISITAFTDAGGSETVAVRTGTGTGTTYPSTTTLSSTSTSATSQVFGSEGEVSWEKFTSAGAETGESGTINVQNIGPYTLVESGGNSISLDFTTGTLVAGNTFTVNTDLTGVADPLSVTTTGTANSIMDTYVFKVVTGGEVGTDAIELEWSNLLSSGTITLDVNTPPIGIEENNGVLDGMTLSFASGTLFADDEFTITTDDTGTPTVNEPADWHWTIDTFAAQFNRQAPGVAATVNSDNTLTFEANANGNKLADFSYVNTQYPSSTDPGFAVENVSVDIDDYQALTIAGTDFTLQRNGGDWSIPASSNPGYTATLTALDDNNLDNGFYVNLDGQRAFTVTFDTPISNDGYMEFDIEATTGNYNFAFSDDSTQDSGVTAALGFNTFFDGVDAMSIEVNSLLSDNKYIATAQIDGDTGDYGVGDNSNALAITNLQHASQEFSQWVFQRDADAVSNSLNSTIEGYYQTMIGKMGIFSQSVTNGRNFSEALVSELTKQRDSISAVSLDEEMVNLMKYQHAFSAASKLLTVADEMLSTLIASR